MHLIILSLLDINVYYNTETYELFMHLTINTVITEHLESFAFTIYIQNITKTHLPGTVSPLNLTLIICVSGTCGVQETSNFAFPSALTKFGTFSPATDTMISKFPAPALLASTVKVNMMYDVIKLFSYVFCPLYEQIVFLWLE